MNDNKPWATIFTGVLIGIVAVVGGLVVVLGDGALSFEAYIDALKNLAIAAGVLGVGRGIAAFNRRA